MAGIVAAFVFIAVDMTAVISGERARANHESMTLVALSMVIAAAACGLLVLFSGSLAEFAVSGLAAAAVVAVAGTAGRVLRFSALPHVGSVVSSASGQIAAIVTAVGGVLLFDDDIDGISALLSLLAATMAVITAVSVSRRDKVVTIDDPVGTPTPVA